MNDEPTPIRRLEDLRKELVAARRAALTKNESVDSRASEVVKIQHQIEIIDKVIKDERLIDPYSRD